MGVKRIINTQLKKERPVISGIGKFIRAFLLVSFLVFSLMYLVPGTNQYKTEIAWPFSYVVWLFQLFTLKLNHINEIFSAYLRTCVIVFGSLGVSLLIVICLLILKRKYGGMLTRLILILVNISSGFHILVLGILYYLLTSKSGYDFWIILILAVGNGSLAEFYNTIDTEIDKILKKEYVLAGVAWGNPILFFPRREIIISVFEIMFARLPILFGSTIIIEYLFSIHGISYLIFYSISRRNFDVLILSTVLVAATIIFFNIVIEDIRYYLDPRVKNATS